MAGNFQPSRTPRERIAFAQYTVRPATLLPQALCCMAPRCTADQWGSVEGLRASRGPIERSTRSTPRVPCCTPGEWLGPAPVVLHPSRSSVSARRRHSPSKRPPRRRARSGFAVHRCSLPPRAAPPPGWGGGQRGTSISGNGPKLSGNELRRHRRDNTRRPVGHPSEMGIVVRGSDKLKLPVRVRP